MNRSYDIAKRDWHQAVADFDATSPYNYAVMDDFLETDTCQRLHEELLAHPDWTRQVDGDHHLFSLMRPDLPAMTEIANQMLERCPGLLAGHEFVDNWVLLYPKDAQRKVHSDVGSFTLNVWLTPDHHNLDESSGGLIYYDVKRREQERDDEDVRYLWSEQYLRDHTCGRSTRVSYRCNRALLFDARTFHQTDAFHFADTAMDAYRMNLSFTFDKPRHFKQVTQALRGNEQSEESYAG